MKIKKSRLLQIIREEVDLHEKYMEENFVELDEEALQDISSEQEADTDGNGKINSEEAEQVFNREKQLDQEAGNLDEINVDLEEVELSREDQIIKKGDGVIKPKK